MSNKLGGIKKVGEKYYLIREFKTPLDITKTIRKIILLYDHERYNANKTTDTTFDFEIEPLESFINMHEQNESKEFLSKEVVDKVFVEQSTVNHPKHYNNNESGIECIDIVEWMTFNQGNAVKYLWRMFDKGDVIENLDKAIWYCKREKERLLKMKNEEKGVNE